MSASDPPKGPASLSPYAPGEITQRLKRLSEDDNRGNSPARLLAPYRQAASVLVAFHPERLRPFGEATDLPSPLALLPELTPSPYPAFRDEYPWALEATSRRAALRQLNTPAMMRRALAANPAPPILQQRVFTDAINGRTFDLAHLGMEELTALSSVSDWLEGTEAARGLPPYYEIHRVIEQRSDQETLRKLASDVFTGRDDELLQATAYLNATVAGLMFVSGLGGTGKSALISQALLLWSGKDTPSELAQDHKWIRVDLDSALVSPDRPITVLQAAATQLARRYPAFSSLLNDFTQKAGNAEGRKDYAQLESLSETDWEPDRLVTEFGEALSYVTSREGQQIAFWIDTFEEAQFLGRAVVQRLLDAMDGLARQVSKLRLIISGRVGLMPGATGDLPITSIELKDLPAAAAESLLKKLVSLMSSEPLTDYLGRRAVKALGGNPLTLRLASPLMGQEKELSLRQLRGIRDDALQRRLFTRILEHIHDPNLRDMAVPGLVVRRITPGVIEHVLAKPCGLGEVSPDRSRQMLDDFANEITLVDREADGSLRHRQDVRLFMLAGMPRALRKTIREIDERAVDYWQTLDGPLARAEEIYHRLRLKQPRSILSSRWLPEAARFLGSALEEWPTASKQRVWLAGMLKIVLDKSESDASSQEEWETQTAIEAQRFLEDKNPKAALNVLRGRPMRLPGSALYVLESRAWLFLNRLRKAIEIAWSGISSCGDQFPERAVELALFAEFIYERQRDLRRAARMTDFGRERAIKAQNPMLQLACEVRQLRIQRTSGIAPTREAVQPTLALAKTVGPNVLGSRPTILRELAAELGGFDAELLRWAANLMLQEILQSMSNEGLLRLLSDFELEPRDLIVSLTNAHPEELRKLVQRSVEECLYSQDSRMRSLQLKLQSLFQDAVSATLTRDFQMPDRQAPQPKSAMRGTLQLDSRLRKQLESAINKSKESTLRRVARFQLRTDFESLGSNAPAGSIAGELLERALTLQRLPQVLADLEKAADPKSAKTLHRLRGKIAALQGNADLDELARPISAEEQSKTGQEHA